MESENYKNYKIIFNNWIKTHEQMNKNTKK